MIGGPVDGGSDEEVKVQRGDIPRLTEEVCGIDAIADAAPAPAL